MFLPLSFRPIKNVCSTACIIAYYGCLQRRLRDQGANKRVMKSNERERREKRDGIREKAKKGVSSKKLRYVHIAK